MFADIIKNAKTAILEKKEEKMVTRKPSEARKLSLRDQILIFSVVILHASLLSGLKRKMFLQCVVQFVLNVSYAC
jgi:hypothetical protein